MEILTIDGRLFVRSFEFYHRAGMAHNHYTRWMYYHIFPIAHVKSEILPAPDNYIPYNIKGEHLKSRPRYYFSIEFAQSLCIWLHTKEARQMRIQLREIIEENRKREAALFMYNTVQRLTAVFLSEAKEEYKL